MNKLKKRKKPGFTLIEMVVVIAVVVIIAAIAIPQALKIVNKSKATTDFSNARTYAGEIMNKVANGDVELVDGTDIKIESGENTVGINAEESKLEKGGEFYYSYDKTNDIIRIKIKTGTGEAAKSTEIYPNTQGTWAEYVSN